VLVALTASAAAVALAACVPEAPVPEPDPEPTASETPAESAPPPEFDPAGDATGNLRYFDLVNGRLIDGGGDLGGRAFVDALVQAGFPKDRMEVTPDRTSIDGAADSVQFSVRFDQGCLVGQYGNIGYASAVTGVLATERCLVGATRPIDW
jgi:hypothetical protein